MMNRSNNSWKNPKIEIVHDNITNLDVDAIVNAANHTLLGGSGVDGAIHRTAGPGLLNECRSLGGCDTGEVKITQGYDLPAKYVIHAVGPIYQGGTKGEAELLASCYRNSLEVAVENHIGSIAFPCISTGVYGYPFEEACEIALNEISRFLRSEEILGKSDVEKIFLVCFSYPDFAIFSDIYLSG